MATGEDLSHSRSHASDEVLECPCKFCLSRDDKQVESTHFCVDCDANLCKFCTQWHQSLPSMSIHQVVDVTTTTGTSGKKGALLPTERCGKHHGKLIDHFCQEHDELCCVSCVAIKHRNCRDVEYLPIFAQDTKKDKYTKKTITSSQTLIQELKQVRFTHHEMLQILNKKDTKSLQTLLDLKTRLVKRIDDLIKAESDMIKSEYQDEREAVQRDIQVLDDQIDITEACSKKLDEFEGDNGVQLFVFMKQVEESERNGKQLINTMKQSSKIYMPHYKITSKLEQYLCDIPQLGEFQKTVQLKYEADYNVRSADDKYCNIQGICVLSDGSVVLADCNNYCLKQLDQSYSIIRTMHLSSRPYDVCYISKNNEVAVTVNGEVQFVRMGLTMKQTRTFPVTGGCIAICYSQDELFVLTDGMSGDVRVCVFTLSGQCSLNITIITFDQEIYFDGDECHIAVSSDGSKCHVTCLGKLYIVDMASKLVSKVNETGLAAWGVCTLHDDSLLVTSKYNNNVLHIAGNGMKLTEVLGKSDGIEEPEAVWYDSASNRVILHTSSSNVLKVYTVC